MVDSYAEYPQQDSR